jgi:uncharacterized protein
LCLLLVLKTGVNHSMNTKYDKLQKLLKDMGRVMIAYSGGVDSTLLLKVAKDVLNENILAVTALSATTPEIERQDAVRLARSMGVEHVLLESKELEIPDFIKNPLEKCYICKKHRFGAMVELARKKKIKYVLDGANLDDHKDFRPGMRATHELGVRSPLSEAGLTKAEIRRISKKLKLPTWDKPTLACLASRIPYGRAISVEKLKQVDAGENYIHKLGLSGQVRVRHEGETARIEVAAQDIARIAAPGARKRVVVYFKKLGFKFVALDLGGYRMGSLNPTKNR